MPRILLLVVLVWSLLGACATAPPAQPTASGGYEITVSLRPVNPAKPEQGTIMDVRVDPPNPHDPAQRETARRLQEDFLRAFNAQMALPTPAPL